MIVKVEPKLVGGPGYICTECKAPMGKNLFPAHRYRTESTPYKFCPLCGACATIGAGQ